MSVHGSVLNLRTIICLTLSLPQSILFHFHRPMADSSSQEVTAFSLLSL